MPGELTKIATQSRDLWRKLTLRRRVLLAGALAAVIVIIAFTTLHTPTQRWGVLMTGLADDDAGQVVADLKAQNIPFQLSGGGVIEVPEDKVHELRLDLAQKGMPRGGGVGFEIFDKQSFGATSFVEQMNYRRALQGELGRTIGALAAVESARVHIAMRERSLYRADDQPPSASVLLKLRPGRKLAPGQIRGIVHLVASSVEGLQPERVTLVDESGNVLASGDDGEAGGETRHELEQTLAHRVEEVLDRMVGVGHAEVVVTAELDEARTEKTEDSYDKDKTALRSETRSEEHTGSGDPSTGGVAGSRGNLPGGPGPTTQSATGGLERVAETRNYEVDHVVSRTIGPKVQLRRLHVAVLVDGVAADPADPAKGMVPRGAEELARIESLARTAAGLETERGDVIDVKSVPFAPHLSDDAVADPKAAVADAPAGFPIPVPTLIVAGGVAAIALVGLTLFMLLRRRRTVRAEVLGLPATVESLENALPGSAGRALPVLGVRERVLIAARKDSERAARLIAGWLAEGAPPKENS